MNVGKKTASGCVRALSSACNIFSLYHGVGNFSWVFHHFVKRNHNFNQNVTYYLIYFRHGNYAASRRAMKSQPCRPGFECSKIARGHPTLTPGIFTVFCPHGICYGFQAMKQHESPAVPFSIFKTRFPVAPRVIIYDNACHLHQYCLNR